MKFSVNEEVKKQVSQDLQQTFFSPSVAVVTPRVFPPCCFHGDELFSPLSVSFSVIQAPLPLPVDKVRAEMCVLLSSCPVCKLLVCVSDLHVCMLLSDRAEFVCIGLFSHT